MEKVHKVGSVRVGLGVGLKETFAVCAWSQLIVFLFASALESDVVFRALGCGVWGCPRAHANVGFGSLNRLGLASSRLVSCATTTQGHANQNVRCCLCIAVTIDICMFQHVLFGSLLEGMPEFLNHLC